MTADSEPETTKEIPPGLLERLGMNGELDEIRQQVVLEEQRCAKIEKQTQTYIENGRRKKHRGAAGANGGG